MAELPLLRVPLPHIERRIHLALAEDRQKREASHDGRLALSQLGGCARNLWASLHRIPEDAALDGRMLVLFEHGDTSEAHLIRLLRLAGFEIRDRDTNGQQYRVVDADGRASGRVDGFITDPSKPLDTWRLLEAKSANESQFDRLMASGYAAWNPKYADQIQIYLGLVREQWSERFGPIDEALVIVEAKNDSRIYAERLRFDSERFHALRQKMHAIINHEGDLPPTRPAEATSQFCEYCKWCPRNSWCWSSTADVRFAK